MLQWRKKGYWDSIPRTTLSETNSSHLKMDGWNTTFLLGWPIFRCYVSFREGMYFQENCSVCRPSEVNTNSGCCLGPVVVSTICFDVHSKP